MQKNLICQKCFKVFDRKSNYARHINRLNSCENKKRINNKDKDKLKKFIIRKYPAVSNSYLSDILCQPIIKPEKIYKCDYCLKSFGSLSYLKKHIDKLCIKNLKFEQHLILEKLRIIDKFKNENQELKEKIYQASKTLPRFYIDEGKLINVEKNYIHYYEQKNIKSFGNEIISHVDEKFMKKMIMNPEVGLANLVRVIHFNSEIPQNRNLFVKSRKFINIEVYEKKGWTTMTKKDIYQNLIVTKKDIMDEYFDTLCNEKALNDKYIYNYETFSDCLDKYINHLVFSTEYTNSLKKARLVYERISKMITLLLLNNQKIEITYTPEQNINTNNIEEKIKNILENSNIDEPIIEEII